MRKICVLAAYTFRLAEAESLMRRMVESFRNFTRATGHPHSHLRIAADNYAGLLRVMGRGEENIRDAWHALGRLFGVELQGSGGHSSSPVATPKKKPHREISIEELHESAGANYGKGYWEAAATDLQKLLAQGEPLADIAPKIVTCLLNAHEDLLPHDAATIEDLLRRLESAGHPAPAPTSAASSQPNYPRPRSRRGNCGDDIGVARFSAPGIPRVLPIPFSPCQSRTHELPTCAD